MEVVVGYISWDLYKKFIGGSWEFIGFSWDFRFHADSKGIQVIFFGIHGISREFMWTSLDFIGIYFMGCNQQAWDMSCLLGEDTRIKHDLLENTLFSLDDFATEMKNPQDFPLPWLIGLFARRYGG